MLVVVLVVETIENDEDDDEHDWLFSSKRSISLPPCLVVLNSFPGSRPRCYTQLEADPIHLAWMVNKIARL